jgi:hypothetical protein
LVHRSPPGRPRTRHRPTRGVGSSEGIRGTPIPVGARCRLAQPGRRRCRGDHRDDGSGAGGASAAGAAVLQHHNSVARGGLYIAPTLTRRRRRTPAGASLPGALRTDVRATALLPLPAPATGPFIAATQQNRVVAVDASSGASSGSGRSASRSRYAPPAGTSTLGITGRLSSTRRPAHSSS